MIDIPVVDLFAGPGGLSEGFSAYKGHFLNYRIALSVEKDEVAFETLKLRSFFRQFKRDQIPENYYRYLQGKITKDQLYSFHGKEYKKADEAVWWKELGDVPFAEVYSKVKTALGKSPHWILLGGPPCQAYSQVGRARMKNMEGFENDNRHTLYREYLKVVAALQPTVFVLENVTGILSSSHKESRIFYKILRDMRNPRASLPLENRVTIPDGLLPGAKYQVYSFSKEVYWEEQLAPRDYIIESESYGVPQRRHRVILLGIKSDLGVRPSGIEKAGVINSVESVIGGLPAIRSRLSHGNEDTGQWIRTLRSGWRRGYFKDVREKRTRDKLRSVLNSLNLDLGPGGRFISGSYPPESLRDWLYDSRIGGVCQHESKAHMPTDLYRYIFASCYADVNKKSPKLDDFPENLLPNHVNARANSKGRIQDFSDRFRVQLANEPATTITAHLRKDGHYFIHPDPLQCRCLTVREAARLQTFPDNYYFEGTRSHQYNQVGNAVPPFLAWQLADIVADVLERYISK